MHADCLFKNTFTKQQICCQSKTQALEETILYSLCRMNLFRLSRREVSDPINRFNPATFFYLSADRTVEYDDVVLSRL
jgi:hypothetical protein